MQKQTMDDLKSAVHAVFTSAFFHIVDGRQGIWEWVKEGAWGVTKFTACLLLLLTFPVSIFAVWWLIKKDREVTAIQRVKAMYELNAHYGHRHQVIKREEGDEPVIW